MNKHKEKFGQYPADPKSVLQPENAREEEVEQKKNPSKDAKDKGKKKKTKKGKDQLEAFGPGISTHDFRKCIDQFKN